MIRIIFNFLFAVCFINGIFAQEFSGNISDITADYQLKISNVGVKGFKITHSVSSEIVPGSTVSCNNGSFHYENSYYLAYDLQNDFNLNGDWIVQTIEFAVEYAKAGIAQKQPLILKLSVMSEYNHKDIIPDSLTLIETDTLTVNDSDSGTLKSIDLSPGFQINEGKVLVVEFLLPDGEEDNNLLFLGSNSDRKSDSTYIRAPHCGVEQPINVAHFPIMFPEMMLITNIYGQYASPNPEIQSFNIIGQIVDTEIKNDPDYTINVVMSADTDLTVLVPIIQIPAGFQVTPASEETQDFSQGSITYTVDNNFIKVSQSWDVSVVNAGPDIINASVTQQKGEIIINGSPDYTVTIPVLEGSDLTDLSPNLSVYDGFTIMPESGTSQDFSSGPVTYTVAHETMPLSQDWQVSVIEAHAGINDINKPTVQIYPNPADNYIYIKLSDFKKAEIFDFNGKILLVSSLKKINLSDLPSGMYFVKLYTSESIFNRKIIINR